MSVADAPKPLSIIVPGDVCRDFSQSSRLEWLDTNHTGAFAMGTVAGVNTRRYHGLLIASLNPPADRCSILPRLEERITVGGKIFELATVQYPGTVQPRGFEFLEEFGISPFPCWRYRTGAARIEKTVCLLDQQQCVVIRYQATRACRLDAQLTLSFRDYHSLTHQNPALSTQYNARPGSVSFTPYPDLPSLTLRHNGNFNADGIWFLNHEYLRELERGLDFREDLFSPGSLQFELNPQSPAWIIAALHTGELAPHIQNPDISSLLETEAARREFRADCQVESMLRRALDQFRIKRSNGKPSLIAGYPWFTDWSRDTLISLPALWKAGFERQESREILTLLADSRSQGVLPNRFADKGSLPEYNTADASLWFFVAAHEFLKTSNDFEFLRQTFYPAARDIAEWHVRGTYYHIQVDTADHLLSAGDPQTQLTWMDAKIGDTAVTPRNGKAVEINALWYNALRILAYWSEVLGFAGEQQKFQSEAELMLASFQRSFWNPDRACLYDVITPSGRDPSVRPNQLAALALPFPLFEPRRARFIADIVRDQLLTPVGLRTLARNAPSYYPRFEGSMAERDRAYHQGAVWPWLMGPFIHAHLYAYEESDQAVSFCTELLRGLEKHFSTSCLGSLTELFDGDPPHLPGGCPSQLWSVAQFLIARERLSHFSQG